MKKIIFTLLATVMLLSLNPATIVTAAALTAIKTASKVTVDGVVKSFDAYTINGNNYFKLRDIAYILSGTTRRFEVTWDGEKNAISLFSGKPYTVIGGEMTLTTGDRTKSAILSTSKVYLEGKEIKLTAYTIDGNNYFKLRDLGSTFDFYVGWDGNNNTVEIESMFSYVPENSGDSYSYIGDINVGNTQKNNISNWANVSPLQQFSYKNEGVAYAYVKDSSLIIVTPSKELSVEMKYPKIGDVISDDDGNFYIVWGKNGTANTEQTVFISKYSPNGAQIKTTGFVGASAMGADGNTKIPFDAGNCVSAIDNGTLMVNYARTMYNGHQSNNVIAVNTTDMSPYKFESLIWDSSQANIPYVSHSFNQSVIYSEKAKDFIFANHGDAYGRGFIIDKLRKEMYTDYEKLIYASKYPTLNIFNFYLEANTNYNMSIVNKTFAQLGGLAETSKGVVLVGASAKSISEAAKTEKQNLFIQIFDPLAKELSSSTVVGGTTRSGATSFDINDNKNSPLTNVTDYGVIWLTNYTDKNVITPQVVVADDHIVILWTENSKSVSESFYMVLSAGGDVITPATSLGIKNLNSYEVPIYHNGLVYWAYTYNGKLRVVSIKP
ncbi:hypothetical protein [Paenibacillus sp. MBLB4367]|uniref:hypothetical protein n=1 Tax=Paenibacillus sp. MBLB4367 TaxID=3384767 RepID=UPI0039083041